MQVRLGSFLVKTSRTPPPSVKGGPSILKALIFHNKLFIGEDEVRAIKAISADEKKKGRVLAEIDIEDTKGSDEDDSEEETTTTVGGKDLSGSGGRGWYKQKW